MGTLYIIITFSVLVVLGLSAPITSMTTRVAETYAKTVAIPSDKPIYELIDTESLFQHEDSQQLQAQITKRFGFQIFKDCKEYNTTWKCIVDCKNAGYFTVKMDKTCKCLCYHPMPTTTPPDTTPPSTSSTTVPTPTNFFEGIKMPTFVGPIWATTPAAGAAGTTTTVSTTPEPCVDESQKVETTTKDMAEKPSEGQDPPKDEQAAKADT